jgi:uncharacterized Tic20 family protein
MSDSTPSASSNQLAGLAHALGILTSFVAPLIIWLTNKSRDAHVDANAREALNFQITIAAAHVANSVLTAVLFFIWPLFGWAITLGLWAISVWWGLLAFLSANSGASYRYPFAFRLVA